MDRQKTKDTNTTVTKSVKLPYNVLPIGMGMCEDIFRIKSNNSLITLKD